MNTLKSKIKNLPIPVNFREWKACYKGSRVLVVSCPKSGTNLVTSLLQKLPLLVPRWQYSIVSGKLDNYSDLKIRKGQYVSSHLFWSKELNQYIIDQNIRLIFIIRDLRDVAVSRAFYHTYKLQTHPIYHRMNNLKSDAERIKLSIIGTNTPEMGFPPLSVWAENYFPWINQDNCLAIRFEELVGSNGGGSDDLQHQTINKIIQHLDYEVEISDLDKIISTVYTRSSKTFRKGIIGDWENHFTDEHKLLFKQEIGEKLISFGYVKDHNW